MKSDFRELIAWRTVHNGATRQFKKTGATQAVYITTTGNGKSKYERTTLKMWKLIKRGILAHTIGEPSGVFDSLFRKVGIV